ncbi:MAG: hypothetical protein CVU39_11580 [Chloroflexi bacterium HGW-Chloroflexi-10]|nr:MAG: hypothetical protein CVU39_11580 [Chloroflexi bacterium HGW-Chloroflexi-10]
MNQKTDKEEQAKKISFDPLKAKITAWRADLSDRKKVATYLKRSGLYLILFLVLYGLGSLLPEGFDWKDTLKHGIVHPIWTPWTPFILLLIAPLGYGFIFALTVMGIGIRSYRYRPTPLPTILALVSLPTLWILFMGNLEGIVLFGMLIMPVGVPLVLMKPQLGAFFVLAKRNWIIASALFGILTLIIWGFWPERFLLVTTNEWRTEWVQDISLFPWGILPGLIFMWFSRGDEDLLMAAGSLMTPHLFPYHFVLLMPSLARMKWYWMLITWVVSWTPLLANWLGPQAWHFGNLMSVCFWFGIYLNRKQSSNKAAPQLSPLTMEEK